MKNLHKFIKIDDKSMIVGIDVGKSTHYACFRTLVLQDPKVFAFSNTKEGFALLIKKIEEFHYTHNLENVIIGLESTGSYWYPLAYHLKSHNDFTIVQVNGKHTSRFKDVTDNTSNKTDRKDPSVIAQIIIIGSSLKINLPEGERAVLRELTRSRRTILDEKKRIQNRLHALLAGYFPELLNLFKDICCKTCLHILRQYSTPESILKTPTKILEKELRSISRGRFDSERVKELKCMAEDTVGVRQGVKGFVITLKVYLDQLDLLMRQVKNLEKEIHELVTELQEYRLLKSIHGLGDISIAIITSEAGDLEKFVNSKEILKFVGLNLVEKSSGNFQGKRRISKIGNEYLRTCLYFAALRMIKKGGIYHDIYQQHLDKGMKKKRAVIAISRKLLRTIHSLIKHDQGFDTEYELKMFNQAA